MQVRFLAISAMAFSMISANGAAKPSVVSDTADFVKAVAAVRADAHNYDKFKEPPKSALTGHSFKVVLPFDNDFIAEGPSYDYESGKLTLKLELEKAAPLLQAPGSGSLEVLLVSEHTRSLGSYVGQNAFGATARVQSLKNDGAGLALVSTPRPMTKAETYDGMAIGSKRGWFYEQDLPATNAKAIALNSAVEVEGTYVDVPWGGAGFCDFSGAEATISNPTDYYRETCYLGARVTRIAFVNESTGAVLEEWTETSAPAVGAELWGGIRIGMSKYEIRALWPAMTDYGSIDVNGQSVSVRMQDDRVSSVEMILLGSGQASVLAALTSKYGKPVLSRCIVETICSAKWNINQEVSVYLTDDSQLVYQAADAPPPIGFSAQ